MAIPINVFAEYGAIGIIVCLFVMMIMSLIKSQKSQNEDLDSIRLSSDDQREAIVSELNDVTDDLNFLKGRINGRAK